jgi:U3 small nucleolar RNA-associated protein 10
MARSALSVRILHLKSFDLLKTTHDSIHEFNQDDIFACFLPYHDSPLFAKMVTILIIKCVPRSFPTSYLILFHRRPTSMWAFLHPYKTSPAPLPRSNIATEMIKKTDLARFVVSLLPSALRASSITVHRSLVAFSTGVVAEYITRHPKIDEGIIAFVLPACVAMVESAGFPSAKDAALAGAILLASLSHRCQLTPAAIESILTSVTQACGVMGEIRAMQTVISVLGPQEQLASLPSGVTREIIHMA